MTKKLINFTMDEDLEFEGLTGKEALKTYTRLNNKYKCKTMIQAYAGNTLIHCQIKPSVMKEKFLWWGDVTKFRNCLTSTRWRITVGRYSITVSGTSHQDFEKTKANNWGEYVEEAVA
jgi:hypothetical protein